MEAVLKVIFNREERKINAKPTKSNYYILDL